MVGERRGRTEGSIPVDQGYVSELFVSFQGEGARVGERHLFVRMAGCNMRCRYCDTPGSLVRLPHLTVSRSGLSPLRVANPVRSDRLVRYAAAFLEGEGPIDAVAVTGGEPLVQADFVARFLREARFPVPVLLETNGALPERLATVLPWVSIISMDIKPPSNTGEGPLWQQHSDFLRIAAGKEVYVKVLIDAVTTEADIAQAARIVAGQAGVPMFLQPIMAADGRPQVDYPTLSRLFASARQFHDAVRVLPQTHKILGIQ
jgi:7-carboxy-7-deazaguanine synthase